MRSRTLCGTVGGGAGMRSPLLRALVVVALVLGIVLTVLRIGRFL